MADETPENPEIIIDEGWKASVEKEKEQAAEQAAAAEMLALVQKKS